MKDVTRLTDRKLLELYATVMEELRARRIVRSANGPGADYVEGLVATAFSLTLNGASTAGYDGIDPKGKKYEIKCRRLTPHNRSRQLSAIRGLEQKHFDVLAGVLFDTKFKVIRAALIPYSVVKEHSTFVKRTNSWKFLLRDSVWKLPDVTDVTSTCKQPSSGCRAVGTVHLPSLREVL